MTYRYARRVRCGCGWSGAAADVLEAESPFDPDDVLRACPNCRTVGEFEHLCDIPGCDHGVSAGVPVRYLNTCSRHTPREPERHAKAE